jgi:hypothetical protein
MLVEARPLAEAARQVDARRRRQAARDHIDCRAGQLAMGAGQDICVLSQVIGLKPVSYSVSHSKSCRKAVPISQAPVT